jgi:hypothetical protein
MDRMICTHEYPSPGCAARIARGLVPFCQISDEERSKPVPKRGYASYSEAAAAHPGQHIVLISGGIGTGSPKRFDVYTPPKPRTSR